MVVGVKLAAEMRLGKLEVDELELIRVGKE